MKYDPKNIEGMSCAAIDVKPIEVDWSEGNNGDWFETFEASLCEKCGAPLVGYNGDTHCNLDDDVKCQGHVPGNEGPMMHYAYPIPESNTFEPELVAIDLAELPVCLILRTGNRDLELALTGGGMDLSWEICEAYMRMGYLPPVHFELPGMAGRGSSARDKWIVAGYLRACEVAEGWAKRKAERVKELAKAAKKRRTA
jgi:hypothetical protein